MLLSLATGSVLDAAMGASKGKLTGEHALLRSLHGRLKRGDILLADAYYSSFDAVMTLVQMGVDVVMRQTANRPTDFRRGTKLGREDHLIEWHRHRNRWKWMSRETFAAMPARASDANSESEWRSGDSGPRTLSSLRPLSRRQGVSARPIGGTHSTGTDGMQNSI